MSHRSFVFLNLTQFFSALNDNIYKLLLVFQLIALMGVEKSNTILSLTGAIFVLPFLLFASIAGTLSDRFSKRTIIVTTRITELFIVSLGVLAFFLQSPFLGYSVLFLMATQSALFSPSKYGIIPEIAKVEEISRLNGILTATTYLAIILGTFFASFLSDITQKNFMFASLFCLIIAIFGALSSLCIAKTKPQAANKKVSARFLSDIFKTLKRAHKIRYLLPTIIFGAYFLFLGAYAQLNIIPFALQSLHLTDVQGGYLFLMTAIGIGIGSFTAGKISGKEVELGLIPIAIFAITLLLFLLYFFQHEFIAICILLIFIGVFGGFYIVPIDAFIQVASPDQDRGENVAAANFLNFLGVIIASCLLYVFGHLFSFSAATGFFIVGIFSFLLSFSLFIIYFNQTFRFLIAKIVSRFWHITFSGKREWPSPSLFIAERVSWLDTLIMMAILPRRVLYIVPHTHPSWPLFFYKFLKLSPRSSSSYLTHLVEEIEKEFALKHSVSLMFPPNTKNTFLKGPLPALPIVSITITRSHAKEKFSSLFSSPITVTYKTL